MNNLILGDCLHEMAKMDEGSVDLIYLDPPFFSNRNYETIWKDRYETASFRDRWEGGIETYVSWLAERLSACADVLSDTGVLVCHLDWHSSHYIKVELDRIFGYQRFINEVIWKRSSAGQKPSKISFATEDDRILIYRKGSKYTFNKQIRPRTKSELEAKYTRVGPDGRRWTSGNIEQTVLRENLRYTYKGYTPVLGWHMEQGKLEALDAAGGMHWTSNGKPRRVYRLEDDKGVIAGSIWTDINPLASMAKERMGYPTQKPLSLLERIIKAFTNEGDLVLDPFCGCGTTVHAAQRINRRWVGMDISPVAVDMMRHRLVEKENLMMNTHFVVSGIPTSKDTLLSMDPTQFADWCCQRLGGRPNPKRVHDMGIDGWDADKNPIQVKQHKSAIGRNVVDNFHAAMIRDKSTKGIIVALTFGRGAKGEVSRLKREDSIDIELVSAYDLLTEQEQTFQKFVEKHDYGLYKEW